MGLSLASVQREGTKTCITSVLLVMRPPSVLRLGDDEKRAKPGEPPEDDRPRFALPPAHRWVAAQQSFSRMSFL